MESKSTRHDPAGSLRSSPLAGVTRKFKTARWLMIWGNGKGFLGALDPLSCNVSYFYWVKTKFGNNVTKSMVLYLVVLAKRKSVLESCRTVFNLFGYGGSRLLGWLFQCDSMDIDSTNTAIPTSPSFLTEVLQTSIKQR